MARVSGLKLNFSDDADVPKIELGTNTTHRIDLIQEKMDNKDYDNLDDMFFNFKLSDCRVALTREEFLRESKLFDKYLLISRTLEIEPEEPEIIHVTI